MGGGSEMEPPPPGSGSSGLCMVGGPTSSFWLPNKSLNRNVPARNIDTHFVPPTKPHPAPAIEAP
jgi:hypothetical protein